MPQEKLNLFTILEQHNLVQNDEIFHCHRHFYILTQVFLFTVLLSIVDLYQDVSIIPVDSTETNAFIMNSSQT